MIAARHRPGIQAVLPARQAVLSARNEILDPNQTTLESIMSLSITEPAFAEPRAKLWTGRVLSGVVVAFLLFDGGIKLAPLQVVNDTLQQLGYSGSNELARGLGAMTLIIALLYAYPRTSILGAVLLTGLLGGAMATHLRVGSPLFSHLFFGLYLGLMAWGGLYMRDPRLRALIPLRSA